MNSTSSGRTMMGGMRRAFVAGAFLTSAAFSASAGAQSPDGRFQPWLGCWVSSSAPLFGAPTDGPGGMVCVIPAQTGNGVNVLSVLNGKIIRHEDLVASGERTSKSLENCPGWQTAVWSRDNHRLLMRSEYSCGSITTVKGSSVMSISSTGEWIQVEGTAVGQNASTAAVRYHPAGLELELTPGQELRDSMTVTTRPVASTFATRSMRLLAGEPVRAEAVLDVAQHVDAPVAEAWLTELDQRFDLNAKTLLALADGGMPSNMIDLMVALSYPQRFAVKRNADSTVNGNKAYASGRGDYARPYAYGLASPFGCSYGVYDDPWTGGYGYNRYSSRGYGCGYGRGYFNDVYYGYRPVIIVPRSSDGPSSRATGHAVNGSGYTRDSGPSTPNRTARPEGYTGSGSSSSSPATSRGSGSSSTGSSSTGSSSSGSSGDGGGRTAKARPPG